ncbi:putative quinol monooxygenase [Streptomyces sp. UNOC14_S4]|uniref:putative quinol monooxygenase n=1 Tax=Streptomyces sp. UNOC14_S4 TaxID=2872340 RepID=UPI000EF762B1|nr:putative quinol monooxygenase [Streptomyces sp. UNOC14_S4]MCC3769989.1 antibiotic biosynthesis monooxygenase [Streptomyces sp. UNOC14_S4]RLU82991.1 antibiotic biosynthesis monooxygenase [Streptomyces griseocarneus]
MIFIVVKMNVRPEYRDKWLDLVGDFTRATREEPGNLFFEWSKSVDNPNQFVLVEGFASREAGDAHVNSAHFKEAMDNMAEAIATTPQIVSTEAPGNGWSAMAELTPRHV